MTHRWRKFVFRTGTVLVFATAVLAPVSAVNCLMLIVFDGLMSRGRLATLYHKLIKLATLRTIKGQRNRVDARGLECG